MRKLFRSYYRPTQEKFDKMRQEATFAFDANVLLNIYRYNPETRGRLFEILKRIQDRIWLPYHMQALMFLVSMGTSYLQVAHYKDRYFIRDGYHRAAGLLREHIDIVPCILIEARNFDEVTGPPQGFLSFEILFGDHPPRLADFWDDEVSHTVLRPATRKVIRVRGDEFDVQR